MLGLAMLLGPTPHAATRAEEPAYVIADSLVTALPAADGHDYRVFVAWPREPAPLEGWPVLYVLDGGDNFATAVETARRLARAGGRSGVGSGVVVAVDSGTLPRRVLDYTPPSPGWRAPAGAPAAGMETGGAEAFLDFMATRLQPWVTSRWHVDPARRTLLGHSFGGLLALHALFTRPALFDRYAAVSPSLWFGGDLIEREEKAARLVPATPLLIATGADERGPNGAAAPAAEALARRLGDRGVRVRRLDLNGQSHGTTMLAAMGQAIALAFGDGRDR